MKILVTGGTVFVSKYIAKYFTGRGDKVYVLNRNTKPQVDGAELIECDRMNLRGRLKDMRFDVVVDAVAYTADDIDALLDEHFEYDKYVMISSSAVYPETLEQPFGESAELGRNKFWGDYGTNKIVAENALIRRAPNAYIIRSPYLYGEYNNIYREAFVFDCAERGVPFYLPKDGTMPLQFFHIEDLCRFIEILIEKLPTQKIFNVGNAPITTKEWVNSCYAVVGKKPSFINVSADVEQRNYFPFYDYAYELDVSAQNKLMPTLLPLNIGLQRAYGWYKSNRNRVITKNYFEYIERNLM